MKKRKYGFFAFVMALVLLAATPAWALTAEEEKADLERAQLLLATGSLYEVDESTTQAKTAKELMEKHQAVDRWARYYGPEEFAQYQMSNEGEMVGTGLYFEVKEDGSVIVMGFVPNSPASRSDIEVGDQVTHIDGTALAGMTKEQIELKFKGEEGSTITIRTLRDGVSSECVMIRNRIDLVSVEYVMETQDVGYIRITEFTGNTADQLHTAISKLKELGAKALVLDLRRCPGGTIEAVCDCSGAFIPSGPAVFVQQRGGREYYQRTENWPAFNLPLAVLVDNTSASGAELLAANIQDAHAGILIGTKTYGKGVMQSVYTLPSGAGVVFTTGRYFSRGYQNVDANHGVTPDIIVSDSDAQMAKALEWLDLQKQAGSKVSLIVNSRTLFVDGVKSQGDYAPYTVNGTNFVPAKETLEALGYQVSYYQNSYYLLRNGQRLELNLTNGQYQINGLTGQCQVQVKNGATYVSANFFREALGCNVTWDSKTQTIGIQLPTESK